MMIVGIDVYHDPSKRNPSVSAVVASMNDTNSKWFSKAHLQEQSVELVDNLRQAFIDILQAYYNANHAWPKSVMIFRDGIGDSQLETSLKIEVEEMFNTFHKVTEGNKKFGFVVVQKRINTKLLLESGENNLDNPPPGTIVDHSITKLGKRDFYLVSQKVNHGTVAPTHYVSPIFILFSSAPVYLFVHLGGNGLRGSRHTTQGRDGPESGLPTKPHVL